MRGVDVGDSRDDLVNYATWWFEAQIASMPENVVKRRRLRELQENLAESLLHLKR
jgi:hypothetical protein